ncbi:hypothetical protein [Pseudomonas guariconensis]|uniref:hypothetical protein n=1 Tax=Pseudomonas guariconensis TaxID=1288410 RepID=UPI002B052207|nr:hypothetical protein [Pseudomonas guariconensis]
MKVAPNITEGRAKWASEHDWFRSKHKLNGFTTPHYKIVVRDDVSTMGIRYFENFEELRAWAGY